VHEQESNDLYLICCFSHTSMKLCYYYQTFENWYI